MASISTDRSNGRRRVLFFGPDGRRKTLRLGKVSKRQAETVKMHVEALLARRRTGALDESTHRWLADLDDDAFRAKLAAVGLIEAPAKALLGPFVADYIKKRAELFKSGTMQMERQTESSLLAFFGPNKRMRDISEGDAEDFRAFLLTTGGQDWANVETGKLEPTRLAEATVRKRCSVAGKIMRYAMRRSLVDKNPFEAVPRANVATKRRAFVDAADARKVLAELPGTQWPLLFALSRWGGLRVGSEVRRLTWADILWDQQKMNVPSPKTEHHAGHEQRMVPIFPELAKLLADRFEEALPGETLVLPMLVGRTDAALRGPLLRAIKRAGLTVWPRLWHSMRGTRQTELENEFPSHVVCAWLGNSEAVARAHYLQVTDDHFAKAAAQNQAQPRMDTDRHGPPQRPVVLSNLHNVDMYGVGDSMKDSPGGTRTPDQGIMSPLL
jgi:integrase